MKRQANMASLKRYNMIGNNAEFAANAGAVDGIGSNVGMSISHLGATDHMTNRPICPF